MEISRPGLPIRIRVLDGVCVGHDSVALQNLVSLPVQGYYLIGNCFVFQVLNSLAGGEDALALGLVVGVSVGGVERVHFRDVGRANILQASGDKVSHVVFKVEGKLL